MMIFSCNTMRGTKGSFAEEIMIAQNRMVTCKHYPFHFKYQPRSLYHASPKENQIMLGSSVPFFIIVYTLLEAKNPELTSQNLSSGRANESAKTQKTRPLRGECTGTSVHFTKSFFQEILSVENIRFQKHWGTCRNKIKIIHLFLYSFCAIRLLPQ